MFDLIYYILLARGLFQVVSGDPWWFQVVPGGAMLCQNMWLVENYVKVYWHTFSVGCKGGYKGDAPQVMYCR